MENIYSERIEALRSLMSDNGWDAVVITGSDPHSSEYPAPRWKQVEWLTGFTGEAGDVVVTADHAGHLDLPYRATGATEPAQIVRHSQ